MAALHKLSERLAPQANRSCIIKESAPDHLRSTSLRDIIIGQSLPYS